MKTLLAVTEDLAARLYPDRLPADLWSGPDDPRLGRVRALITGWGTPTIDGAFLERRAPDLRLIVHTGGTIRGIIEPRLIERGRLAVSSAAAVMTPHLAGSGGRELRRLGAFAAAEIERFAAGQPLHGAVTAADLDRIA